MVAASEVQAVEGGDTASITRYLHRAFFSQLPWRCRGRIAPNREGLSFCAILAKAMVAGKSYRNVARSVARKLLLWSVRSVFVLVLLLTGLAVAGAIYQTIGNWRDARRFPQRGTSVQAGPVRLNIDCAGRGSPAVILDSGMGIPALGWMRVQPEVAKFTHVCSYDRAGYGWSDPGPEPRTSVQIANELKALLDAAGEKGPFVLVGHSFGGFNIRVFAKQHPNDVVGVVLLDASHEDWEQRLDALLSPEARESMKRVENFGLSVQPYLIRFGIQRALVAAGVGMPSYASGDFFHEILYLEEQPKAVRALMSENRAFAQSGAQARAAGNLGVRPLIVLTAGNQHDPISTSIMSKEEIDKQGTLWVHVLQPELTHLSTRGKQIIVQDSDHMIPFERPQAVVAAIHEVWSASINSMR